MSRRSTQRNVINPDPIYNSPSSRIIVIVILCKGKKTVSYNDYLSNYEQILKFNTTRSLEF